MNSKRIKTIIVDKLFGMYDYHLSIPAGTSDNVFILYGDNGTGKSTILRMLYHLLSSEPGHAHKTNLANIAFKAIEVVFDDNTRVRAEREKDCEEFLGEYTLLYSDNNEVLQCKASSTWDVDSGKFRVSFFGDNIENRKRYHLISEKLRGLNVFYISDKRNEELRGSGDYAHARRPIPSDDPVEREMRLLHEWIVSQALEASKKGEEGTSGIYIKILSELGKKQQREGQVKTVDEIQSEIEKLEKKTQQYVNMGFISDTDYKDVSAGLRKVHPDNQEVAANILTPYIEIQNNRLHALDNLVESLSYLLDSLNEYLYKKRVVYSVNEGFKIFQENEHNNEFLENRRLPENDIDIKKLSSGERQLLRLFSMVIRKSNFYPIIIIDEPEISLNIKWQRRLLSTLNYFVRDTEAQFVIATHSFEILASHTMNTVKVGDSFAPDNYA